MPYTALDMDALLAETDYLKAAANIALADQKLEALAQRLGAKARNLARSKYNRRLDNHIVPIALKTFANRLAELKYDRERLRRHAAALAEQHHATRRTQPLPMFESPTRTRQLDASSAARPRAS